MRSSFTHLINKPALILSYLVLFALPLSAFWPLLPPTLGGLPQHYDQPLLFWADIPLIALLLWLVVKRPTRTTPIPEFQLALIGLVCLAFITAPFALYPAWATYNAIRWLLTLTLFYWFQQQDLPLSSLIICFLCTFACQTVISLMQIMAQSPLGLPGEMTLPPNVLRAAVLDTAHGRWLRPYGLTFHPNVLGGYLCSAILLAIPLLKRRFIRHLWLFLWLGLFLTFSRSAWLATTVTILPLFIWLFWKQPNNRRHLAQSAFLVTLTLFGAFLIWQPQVSARLSILQPIINLMPMPHLTQPHLANNPNADPPTTETPLNTLEQTSVNERVHLNQAALRSIRAQPLAGVGAGNFPYYIVHYEATIQPQPVHNTLLLILSEIGFIGAACWLLIWLTCGQYLYHHAAQASPWALASMAALIAIGIIGLFDFYPWGLPAGQRLSFFLFALVSRTWSSL